MRTIITSIFLMIFLVGCSIKPVSLDTCNYPKLKEYPVDANIELKYKRYDPVSNEVVLEYDDLIILIDKIKSLKIQYMNYNNQTIQYNHSYHKDK